MSAHYAFVHAPGGALAPRPWRPARSASAVLLVAALHLLGLWAWLVSAGRPWLLEPLRTSPPITVWLRELSPAPTETAERPPNRPRQGNLAERAAAATAPATGAPSPAEPSAPAGDSASQTPLPPGTPLNLALPRGAMATLAKPSLSAQTPFHGRLPATVERQLETAAGETGPWTEERLDYDHVRFRRGNTCVTMERPAASRIDPGNDALQRLPWLANVYKCP